MSNQDNWNEYYKPALGVLWSASMLAFFIWLTKSLLYGTALVIVVSLVIAVIDTMMGKIKWPYGKK